MEESGFVLKKNQNFQRHAQISYVVLSSLQPISKGQKTDEVLVTGSEDREAALVHLSRPLQTEGMGGT